MCVRNPANHSGALEMVALVQLSLTKKNAFKPANLDGNGTRVLLELPDEILSHILSWIHGQFVSFCPPRLFFRCLY
jgi:hypothetical protein